MRNLNPRSSIRFYVLFRRITRTRLEVEEGTTRSRYHQSRLLSVYYDSNNVLDFTDIQIEANTTNLPTNTSANQTHTMQTNKQSVQKNLSYEQFLRFEGSWEKDGIMSIYSFTIEMRYTLLRIANKHRT